MSIFSTMVVVPAFNEEDRIGKMLDELIKFENINEILIVDDGSTDNTLDEIKKRNLRVVSHSKNRGKGDALRTGVKEFLQTEHDIIIFIDADGQHDPTDIKKFQKKFEIGNDDIIIASRFGTDQWIKKMPFLRKLSNLLSRFGIWILFNRLIIEDPQNGYRAFRREVFENISFQKNGYEAETEIIINSHMNGYKIGHVHIETIYDADGNSSKFSLLMDTWKIPNVMIKLFFRLKPFLKNRNRKN